MNKTQMDPANNYRISRQHTGYVARRDATPETYTRLGFKCGLEVHQQLKTKKKLFCRCPTGIYQTPENYDAEVVRHMRPTLSEMGTYDGTALMEFKTRKNIYYRVKLGNSCTYEIDDTPPFPLNRDALNIAIEIALLLKTNIVGELHITRKQYLDGSIPTGFQRTAIVGVEGSLPISNKKVRVIQLSIEEDSCREVSDIRHNRVYMTDRLGTPLIETVTYPDLLTPDEAAEAAHYIRFLCRSTGKVNTGIGAAREDVNVSIAGGVRVEIKGVAHIRWIPELTHNEGFRQKALLNIREILLQRIPEPEKWNVSTLELTPATFDTELIPLQKTAENEYKIMLINLPAFKGLLSHFTQPGKCFANEISERLKVIACLEKPNMIHSEEIHRDPAAFGFGELSQKLNAGENDAQIIFWGPAEDITTAVDTIRERCQLAFMGVPNETRKAFPDGTTIFERVLPGADRMYPDTDSAPISIHETTIDAIRSQMPADVDHILAKMKDWSIPADTFHFILKRNLFHLIERIIRDFNQNPRFIGVLIGHQLKHLEGQAAPAPGFDEEKIYKLFQFIHAQKLEKDIIRRLLPTIYRQPDLDFESVLSAAAYRPQTESGILQDIPSLKEKFREIRRGGRRFDGHAAMTLWLMGQLRPQALGNINMERLHELVETEGGAQ